MPTEVTVIQEGKATFQVGKAFYRPQSQMARDLGILAAAIARSETGSLRVLEGMAGCGVRSLRYLLEANADFVWVNDADPDLETILTHNLKPQLASQRCQISHQDAHKLCLERFLEQDYYDLVDLDGFGNPAADLSAAVAATRLGGMIYLTSTDGRTIAGRDPEACLRLWGGYGRSHPAVQEQGLRFLVSGLAQQAGRQGWGIQPLFSLFQGQTYRVMVRLVKHPWQPENMGFLSYCHHCGQFETLTWRRLGQSRCCQHQTASPCAISGPLWLGRLHDPTVLEQMIVLAQTWGWTAPARLLAVMHAETALPPYFYTLGEIGRRGKLDLPNRDLLLQALQNQGYLASATHITPQAIKTMASLSHCIEMARQLSPLLSREQNQN